MWNVIYYQIRWQNAAQNRQNGISSHGAIGPGLIYTCDETTHLVYHHADTGRHQQAILAFVLWSHPGCKFHHVGHTIQNDQTSQQTDYCQHQAEGVDLKDVLPRVKLGGVAIVKHVKNDSEGNKAAEPA